MIRRLIGALTLVAIGIPMPVAAAPAQPVSGYDGPCVDNVGITIVIDFRELTGGVNVRCAPGPVTSGLDALDKAGILWEGTQRFPGLVCRIAGMPRSDTEACVNAPPLSAYWGYWLAQRGGQWCFSNLGAGSRKPPAGTVEGWSFALNRTAGDTPPPGYAPPPPIEGQPPNPLNSSDCGIAVPSPPPATTTTPTVAPTTPTTVLAESQTPPPATADAVPVVPSPTAAAKGASQAVSGSTTSTSTTTVSSIVVTSVGASTTQSSTDGTGSLDIAVLGVTTSSASVASSTVPLGTVDLGSDGGGGGGFGAATAIGIVLAASLAGAGAWAARRRRAGP